jgi:hypothetical protein
VDATATAEALGEKDCISFRLASDWGSAFAGQDVEYMCVVRNECPEVEDNSNDLQNVIIHNTLPSNVEVVDAAATPEPPTPAIAGNNVDYSLDVLPPGEEARVIIDTTIKDDVPAGTLLVDQCRLEYDGLLRPILSNIITVLVVPETSEQQPTATATLTATTRATTGDSSPRSAATRTATPTATPASQAAADTPTATAAAAASVPQEDTDAPADDPLARPGEAGGMPAKKVLLPKTSTGVPLAGFVLLGLTMITRTVRLHRARERV